MFVNRLLLLLCSLLLIAGCGGQAGLDDEIPSIINSDVSDSSAADGNTQTTDVSETDSTESNSLDAEQYYVDACAACHGGSGEGFGAFPALDNDAYELSSLTAEIAATMPLGDVASCDQECAAAVAEFILVEFVGREIVVDQGNEQSQGSDSVSEEDSNEGSENSDSNDEVTPEEPDEPQQPEAPSAPSAVSSVIAVPQFENQQIRVTWQDNALDEAGSFVYRSVDSNDWVYRQFVPANHTEYSDSDVAEGHSYQYRVAAFNEVGEAPAIGSNRVILTPEESAPNAPQQISAEYNGSSAAVTWIDSSDNETHFVLEKRINSGEWNQLFAGSGTTHQDDSIAYDNSYQYRVKAVNGAGESIYVESSVNLVGFSADRATYYQNNCAACHGNDGTGAGNFPGVDNPNYELNSLAELIADTMPLGNIDSCTGSCAESIASYILENFAVEKLPAAVTNVVAVPSSAHDFIGVSWTDSADNETGFRVYRQMNNGSWQLLQTLSANSAQLNDSDVADGNDYRYRVAAFNTVGESIAADGNTVMLRAIVTLPNSPSNLQSTVSGYQIQLSWQDNADNEDNYIVERRTGSSWQVLNSQIVGTTFFDSQVAFGEEYEYRVKAENSAGTSAYSNTTAVELPYELTYQQTFEEKCSGCHNAQGGTGGDLFDGFKVNNWSNKYFSDFMAKVATMSTLNCGETCRDEAATYVWVTQWDFDKFTVPEGSSGRGVRGIRLLTPYEYKNTIATIFNLELSEEQLNNSKFETDFQYPTQADAGVVISDDVLKYKTLAEFVAENVNLTALGCSEASCSNTQLESLAIQILRRSLTNAELTTYQNFQSSHGARDTIASLLMSPYFLYRMELGEWDNEAEAYKLDGFELISALAFELWGTSPSLSLLNQATAGNFSTVEQVQAQVDVMIADSRFAEHFVEFIRYYTKTYEDTHEKPGLTLAVIDAMKAEQGEAVKYWLEQDDASLASLFSPGYTYVNNELASHYDIPGNFGSTMVQVNTDDNRGGLLHQGILHILNSDFAATSLVKRGKMIRENMLCHTLGVPSGVDPDTIELPEHAITTRERWNVITGPDASEGQCWQCHQLMNEPGSALENFDQTGHYRLEETAYNDSSVSLSIDATGILRTNDGLNQLTTYDNARDLADFMGESSDVMNCFVDNYYRYSRGHHVDSQVLDDVDAIQEDFSQHRNVKTLVRSLFSAESFLYRLDR